jgi:hypothetical protein
MAMQTIQIKSRKPLSILPVLQRMQNVTGLQAFMRGIGAAVIAALAVALLRMGPAAARRRAFHPDGRYSPATEGEIVPLVLGRAIAATLRKTLGWEQLVRLTR